MLSRRYNYTAFNMRCPVVIVRDDVVRYLLNMMFGLRVKVLALHLRSGLTTAVPSAGILKNGV